MRKVSNEELYQWIGCYEQDRARARERGLDRETRHALPASSRKRADEGVTEELLMSYWKADVRLYENQIAFYRGLKE